MCNNRKIKNYNYAGKINIYTICTEKSCALYNYAGSLHLPIIVCKLAQTERQRGEVKAAKMLLKITSKGSELSDSVDSTPFL